MKISNQMRAKIMQWEGCELNAYRCPAGILTIGYGHTGPDVKEGMKISAVEAVKLFNDDIDKFTLQVEQLLNGVELNQNQFDSLISIAYNIGLANLKNSTLLKKVLTNSKDTTIASEFLRWNKARVNGKLTVLKGLEHRRRQEANHYFTVC